MALPVYVHIPFCASKCRYCDFNSYAGREDLVAPYLLALAREIRNAPDLLAPDVERATSSIYIGGGTPSLLAASQVQWILASVAASLPWQPGIEITIEANPGTVDESWLRDVRAAGVTRLSLGVQAMDDHALRSLGRIHSAAEAVQALELARRSGFRSVSLDLMYGLPGQSTSEWQDTLNAAIGLGPDHLSLYALTVEERTPLGRDIAAGRTPAPDDDEMAFMYEYAEEALAAAGFWHYEISNWSRPGHECRHNLAYWRNQPFLGVGTGAHSSFPGAMLSQRREADCRPDQQGGPSARWQRWSNTCDPDTYITRMELEANAIEAVERLTRDETMWETVFLGLRLVDEGLSQDVFSARFGEDLDSVYGVRLAEVEEAGLIERSDGRVRLTSRGRLLSNEVFVRLAPESGAGSRP